MSERVVVVGGGIAGLTAAHLLGAPQGDGTSPEREVLVLEAADRVGGKLRRETVAGVTVDVGAEAMLHRRPEGVDLAREVGLEVVHPTGATSRVWTGGGLRPLPRSLMGVPLDLDELAASGVLSEAGLARVRAEPDLPAYAADGDPSVGDLVGERFGEEVVERLVEPLLGGVYAGHARHLSARATVPQLVQWAARGSLLEQAAALPSSGAPVFAGFPGGMARLAEALAATGRFDVRTGVTVRALRRTGTGFALVTGPTTDEVEVAADRVVLATPAAPTARLLADVAPAAARELAAVESASVAVVTFAFRRADLPDVVREASGFLVPPAEGRAIKAATFSASKWAWVTAAGEEAGGLALLRTSLGRHGEEAALQVPDAELVRLSREDLAAATGLAAEPVDVHVQRWGGGLPQYPPGHLERVARVRAAVAEVPGLSVCGAAYDGVGIPAVVASARRATMGP